MLKNLLFLFLFLSTPVFAKETNSPIHAVSSFLENMKSKNYSTASTFISKAELKWLKQSTLPLLKNKEFIESYGIQSLDDNEISSLTDGDIFELWSYIALEIRDKSFGSYVPENVLGSIRENDILAHVVVKDIINPEHEALVYTVNLEENTWKIKLPRIVKGTVTISKKIF
ncbi:hypothetical protein [Pseudoalteromonas phenolica]|uniref:hypothetical protein n=1 Tax=Pseudoalteromonas phenolica TaxID=161398 RepID=UPI00384D8D41